MQVTDTLIETAARAYRQQGLSAHHRDCLRAALEAAFAAAEPKTAAELLVQHFGWPLSTHLRRALAAYEADATGADAFVAAAKKLPGYFAKDVIDRQFAEDTALYDAAAEKESEVMPPDAERCFTLSSEILDEGNSPDYRLKAAIELAKRVRDASRPGVTAGPKEREKRVAPNCSGRTDVPW